MFVITMQKIILQYTPVINTLMLSCLMVPLLLCTVNDVISVYGCGENTLFVCRPGDDPSPTPPLSHTLWSMRPPAASITSLCGWLLYTTPSASKCTLARDPYKYFSLISHCSVRIFHTLHYNNIYIVICNSFV